MTHGSPLRLVSPQLRPGQAGLSPSLRSGQALLSPSLRSGQALVSLLSLLSLLSLVSRPASAQPIRIEAGSIPRTVTVAGDALVEAAPDRAVVRVGVQTDGQTAAETLERHEEDVERVLTTIRRAGIADRQIEIESLSLGERWAEGGRRDGFTAIRVVVVTVDDLREVPEIVSTAVAQGANRLDGLFYTLRDADRFEDQALEQAFERAREKAERLAAAAGLSVGRVVEMHEQGLQPPVPMPVRPQAMEMDARAGAYSAGTSEVRATVVVTFALDD